MKRIVLMLSGWVFSLALLACTPQVNNSTPTRPSASPSPAAGATATPTSPRATETPEPVDPGFNLLVAAEGEVQLKRSRWSDYHLTTFGAPLQRGDLLKLGAGAKATILCDGLTLWRVPAGGAPAGLTNGCPQPANKILVSGSIGIAGVTRSAPDPNIPYIMTPRMTSILTDTPVLRWNDSKAASYTVIVRGGELNWVQTGVPQTELTYPGEPALQPGVAYLLVVEDSNGNSSQDEGQAGLGFNLLAEAEAERVQTNSARVAGLGLAEEGEAFALAQFYAGHDLIAEAIDILEAMVEAGNQQAVVHQALANLYTQIGLLLLAEPRYLAAVDLAERQGNVEAVADIQASLADVYIRLRQPDKAIPWLTQAQAGYETLGDMERAERMRQQVERWE